MNLVVISGRLTRDAEVRTTATGKHVLAFGLAVNDRVRNSETGEYEYRPNFVDVNYFTESADKLAEFMTKGFYVANIKGRLRWQSWERDGQKRSKLEVVAESLEFAPLPQEENAAEEPELYEEDIPF